MVAEKPTMLNHIVRNNFQKRESTLVLLQGDNCGFRDTQMFQDKEHYTIRYW